MRRLKCWLIILWLLMSKAWTGKKRLRPDSPRFPEEIE